MRLPVIENDSECMGSHDLEIEFFPAVVDAVKQVNWHKCQQVFATENGSVVLKFRDNPGPALVGPILYFQNEVKAARPAKLKKMELDKLDATRNNYLSEYIG